MTTGKKLLLFAGITGGAWTIFYFAYWQGRNAVKPADIPALQQSTVSTGAGGTAVPSSSSLGMTISGIGSAIGL